MIEKISLFLMYMLVLSVTNVFGMVEVLEEYRVAGVGKPSDFILIFLNVLTLIAVFGGTNKELPTKLKAIIKANIYLLLYVIFLVFYTVYYLRIGTVNYSLRTASDYFYYSSFLFPLYLIRKEKSFVQFVNFLRIGGIVTGIIAIASNVLGHSIATGVLSSQEGGFVRVYLPGFFNYFVIMMWLAKFLAKTPSRFRISYPEVIINALGILLFLGRTRIIVSLLMMIFIFLFITKSASGRKKVILAVPILVLAVYFFMLYFNLPMTTLIDRFILGYDQLQDQNQALTGRLPLIIMGFGVFLNNPFFGTGFVHPTTDFYLSNLVGPNGMAITNSNDFGLVSMLYTTGLVGILIILNFFLRLLAYLKEILVDLRNKKLFDDSFRVGISLYAIVLFIFFVEQLAGNEFASRVMVSDLLTLGFCLKFLEPAENESEETMAARV